MSKTSKMEFGSKPEFEPLDKEGTLTIIQEQTEEIQRLRRQLQQQKDDDSFSVAFSKLCKVVWSPSKWTRSMIGFAIAVAFIVVIGVIVYTVIVHYHKNQMAKDHNAQTQEFRDRLEQEQIASSECRRQLDNDIIRFERMLNVSQEQLVKEREKCADEMKRSREAQEEILNNCLEQKTWAEYKAKQEIAELEQQLRRQQEENARFELKQQQQQIRYLWNSGPIIRWNETLLLISFLPMFLR